MSVERGGSRWVSRVVWLAVLAGLGAGVYEWRDNGAFRERVYAAVPALKPAAPPAAKAAAPPQPVPVSATKAVLGDFPVVLLGLGTVQANNTVLVRSRVDGQIVKINFTEGQIVKKGDLLAEIDPRPYKAALEQAQAKKQQDDANLANANRDLDRYRSLAKNDYATRQQLDTQTAQVAQLTAQIAADQAAVDNAQTQFDYATISAPLTGRVGFRLTDQGNIVNASGTSGIVEIAQLEPIAVIYTAPENALGQLQAGIGAGPVAVDALSSDGKTLLASGRLDTLNNEVDAASGTIRIKAIFDNRDHKLWPGLAVTTRTTVAVRKGVVIVPVSAVQRGQNGFYAFVVDPDGKAQVKNLKMGLVDDTQALVTEGLKPDDLVVTAGQYRLQAGTPVKVGDAAAQTASKEP